MLVGGRHHALKKGVQEHLGELACMANTMAHNVTHYARPVLHVTCVHTYYTIIATRKHKAVKTMISPLMKYINLVRQHLLDLD